VTWNRTISAAVPFVTTRGSLRRPSTRSRCGGAIPEIWSGCPLLPAGQPAGRGGAEVLCTTAVGTDVALVVPSELPAVTEKRKVAPTSAEVRT
jgi:hypothetical protein